MITTLYHVHWIGDGLQKAVFDNEDAAEKFAAMIRADRKNPVVFAAGDGS